MVFFALGSAHAESATDASAHSIAVSYNVALVAVSPIDGGALVFDNSPWTSAGVQSSNVIERTSGISYTLASHKTLSNSITAALSWESDADLGALKVTLVLASGSGVVATSDVVLKDFAASPAAAQTVVETSVNGAGVHATDLLLTYKFQIDVTQGPAFAATPITVTYTATAAAP